MEIKSASGDKVFVSFSGGKDAYLSLLLAKEQKLDVVCLLSFVSAEGESRSHGLRTGILEQQAELLGIPLEVEEVSWETYEDGFEKAVKRIKQERAATGGVFGDINLAEHRAWIKKMAERCEIDYNLPLWQMEEVKVLEELLKRDILAMVVAIRSDLVEQRWLGKFIDQNYIDYCINRGISPCGESGETHTLVVDGPYFDRPLKYRTGKIKQKDNRTLLDVF